MEIPEPAYQLAEVQRGLIGRHQLRRFLPDQVVDDLVRSARVDRVARGVVRFRGAPSLPEHPAFAAALRARPDATITGPLALRLLGVRGFEDANRFLILTREGRRLRPVSFEHRPDHDRTRPVATFGEVRVAGPLDALLDAAGQADVPERDLRVAWDHLRGERLASVDQLRRRSDELRGRAPGVEVLEAILERAGGVLLESEGERLLAPVLSTFDPPFEPQVWVTPRRRVDFLSRRCRYGYEYLGAVDHASVARRIEDDARDAELRREGVRLGYVTRRDLDEPDVLLATIAGTLTVRAHELGVEPPVARRGLARPAA